MQQAPIRVGLIGYGLAGESFHAPLITSVPGLRLAAVVERRSARSRERYPWVNVVTSAEALIASRELDLVVIATPNSTHCEYARAALEAGKHVVVDKPLTVTSDEAEQLIALSEQRRRLLTVFHNRRWDGDFLTVQQLVRAGALGKVVEYESHFDRFRPRVAEHAWREAAGPGSGILHDLGVHLIDQALLLFGPPDAVSADVGTQRSGAVAPDFFHLRLHYPAMVATLKAGMLIRAPRPRFALYGTEASFVKYGLDPQEAALRRGETPASPDWGEDPPEHWGTRTPAEGSSGEQRVPTAPGRYQSFYEGVRDAIQGRAPVPVTPQSAAATIRIIEEAMLSAQSGARRQL